MVLANQADPAITRDNFLLYDGRLVRAKKWCYATVTADYAESISHAGKTCLCLSSKVFIRNLRSIL